jgi:hypothetical protein
MAILIQITKSANVAFKYCRECRGDCCRSLPGATEPLQWGKTKPTRIMKLANAFTSGFFIVDRLPVEHLHKKDTKDVIDDWVFYVRPATTEEADRSVLPSSPVWYGGERGPCCYLTENGCSLLAKARPTECRDLIPHMNHRSCSNKKRREDYVALWIPFQVEIAIACKMAERRRAKAA